MHIVDLLDAKVPHVSLPKLTKIELAKTCARFCTSLFFGAPLIKGGETPFFLKRGGAINYSGINRENKILSIMEYPLFLRNRKKMIM